MDFDNETLYHHQPFLLQIHIQDILRKREFFNIGTTHFQLNAYGRFNFNN